MKNKILAILFSAVVVNIYADVPKSADELAGRVSLAIINKDKKAMENLCCWDGVSVDMRADLTEDNNNIIKAGVTNSSAVTNILGFLQEYEAQGKKYHFNLPILGYIQVGMTNDENAAQIPYGEKDGGFYLTSAIPIDPSAVADKWKIINIQVRTGGISPSASNFNGYYIYVNSGKETKEEINGEKNATVGFQASDLKYCQVELLSTNGWIQLMITENGGKVFDTKKEGSGRIIYQLKQ
jgi:hypothetical protein